MTKLETELVDTVKGLLRQIGHLEVCADCAEDSMSACLRGGQEIIRVVAGADELLHRIASQPVPAPPTRTEEPEKKQRVFFGPFEEPDRPCAVMDLDIAQQTLKQWFEEGEVGDVVSFRIEEMTEAEIDALPDL